MKLHFKKTNGKAQKEEKQKKVLQDHAFSFEHLPIYI